MGIQGQNRVYVSMMVDALKRKRDILELLLEKTREQEILLRSDELNSERFNAIIDEKGDGIDEINTIDEGFDALFRQVKKEITADRLSYKREIEEMQELIARVSELGVQIQALEHQNSERFKMYLARQRKIIRDFHVNNRTASNYYQNMANVHKPEQSYFFDATK